MPERRTLVYAGSAGLLALHTVADAFLMPERGTAWSDHLVPGLATLAILAGAVALYVVAPPGLRGVLALVLGVLALEGFAIAVIDARNVGARGDDWTGFLLAPAGLALCALGAITLWRSRKPGRLRYLRRAGLALGALARRLRRPRARRGSDPRHAPAAATGRAGRARTAVRAGHADGRATASGSSPGTSPPATAPPSSPTRPAKGSCHKRASSSGTATASSYSTPAATTAATAPRTCSAGARPRTSTPRSPGSATAPTSTKAGSAASASRSAAKCCSRRAAQTRPQGRRLRRRRHPLAPRRAPLRPPQHPRDTRPGRSDSGRRRAQRHCATAVAPGCRRTHLAARRLLHLRQARPGRRGAQQAYFRAAREPKEIWRVDTGGHTGAMQAQPRTYERRVVGFFDRTLLTTRPTSGKE